MFENLQNTEQTKKEALTLAKDFLNHEDCTEEDLNALKSVFDKLNDGTDIYNVYNWWSETIWQKGKDTFDERHNSSDGEIPDIQLSEDIPF